MIDASDLDDAARALDPGLLDDALDELGDDATAAIAAEVRAGARKHRRSGRLERNIRVRQAETDASPSWTVRAGGMVAPIIVGGSRPHLIRPVRSRALPLASPAGAVRGFAGAVRHPGTRPDPFVQRGLDAALGDVRRLGDDTIDELAADLAGEIRARTEG